MAYRLSINKNPLDTQFARNKKSILNLKKMKQKIFIYFVPAVLGMSVLGAGMASAHGLGGGFGMSNLTADEIAGRQTSMFENQANLLGISVDKVKQGWAEGKTLQQIAQDNNITPDQLKEKMKAAHLEMMKTHLSALVSKGVITQAQADQRLSAMQNMIANGKGRFLKGPRGAF